MDCGEKSFGSRSCERIEASVQKPPRQIAAARFSFWNWTSLRTPQASRARLRCSGDWRRAGRCVLAAVLATRTFKKARLGASAGSVVNRGTERTKVIQVQAADTLRTRKKELS